MDFCYRFGRLRSAFSLMEIMVVVFIIGLIFSMIGPRIMTYMAKAKERSTEAKLNNIKQALMDYSMEVGYYPQKLQDLIENTSGAKKWKGPYWPVDKELKDDWGNDIVYNKPPQILKQDKGWKQFELISYGAGQDESNKEEWIAVGG